MIYIWIYSCSKICQGGRSCRLLGESTWAMRFAGSTIQFLVLRLICTTPSPKKAISMLFVLFVFYGVFTSCSEKLTTSLSSKLMWMIMSLILGKNDPCEVSGNPIAHLRPTGPCRQPRSGRGTTMLLQHGFAVGMTWWVRWFIGRFVLECKFM